MPKLRKRITNYYTEPQKDIYISNVCNSDSNMITVLTVPTTSNYNPPYVDRFLNCDYMPDVRLIAKEYKRGFNYYVYDINFTLTKDKEVTDEIIGYLVNHIFGLKLEY